MIGEICTKPAVTVSAVALVRDAARLMRTTNVGALVVVDEGKPSGIVTDRDLALSVVAEGRDPESVRVREVMRKDPAVIDEGSGILDTLQMFRARGVRRLPVVNKTGILIGIITLDDLLILLGTEMGHVSAAVSRELGQATSAPTR